METHSYDVTVLGGGPGGYVAAIRAAQYGKRVAVVERERLGGICLNWGCIPTKALLRLAERREWLREAESWGLRTGEVEVDWGRIIARSREAADRLARGVEGLLRKHAVRVHAGTGRFLSPHRLEVERPDGTREEIQTTHTVVATGARAASIPGVEPDGERVVTYREAMVMPERPRRMVVIGAGAIGLEFAYFYAAFGTEVTLLEAAPRIAPTADPEISDALTRSFRRRGVTVRAPARVLEVRRGGEAATVRYEADGEEETVEADAVLVATGVRGNVEDLGLERVAIEPKGGFIPVDGHRRTGVEGVYAIGDVAGPPALAHAASADGILAVRHLAGDAPEPIDPRDVPACIYCQPQVAMVGLTEPEAAESGRELRVGRFPFSANGKAVACGEAAGFVKIVGDARTGELLGAHVVGPEATELIAELVLARSSELTVHDLHHAVHAHPTLSESVLEAAADWEGLSTAI